MEQDICVQEFARYVEPDDKRAGFPDTSRKGDQRACELDNRRLQGRTNTNGLLRVSRPCGRVYQGVTVSGHARVHNGDHIILVQGNYIGGMRASRQTFGGVVGLSIDWVLDVTFDVFVRFWQTLTLAHSAPRPPLGTYAIFRDFLFEEFKVDIGTIQGWKGFEFIFWQREQCRTLDTSRPEWKLYPEMVILYTSLQKGLTNGYCISMKDGPSLLLADSRKDNWHSYISAGCVYQMILPPDDLVDSMINGTPATHTEYLPRDSSMRNIDLSSSIRSERHRSRNSQCRQDSIYNDLDNRPGPSTAEQTNDDFGLVDTSSRQAMEEAAALWNAGTKKTSLELNRSRSSLAELPEWAREVEDNARLRPGRLHSLTIRSRQKLGLMAHELPDFVYWPAIRVKNIFLGHLQDIRDRRRDARENVVEKYHTAARKYLKSRGVFGATADHLFSVIDKKHVSWDSPNRGASLSETRDKRRQIIALLEQDPDIEVVPSGRQIPSPEDQLFVYRADNHRRLQASNGRTDCALYQGASRLEANMSSVASRTEVEADQTRESERELCRY